MDSGEEQGAHRAFGERYEPVLPHAKANLATPPVSCACDRTVANAALQRQTLQPGNMHTRTPMCHQQSNRTQQCRGYTKIQPHTAVTVRHEHYNDTMATNCIHGKMPTAAWQHHSGNTPFKGILPPPTRKNKTKKKRNFELATNAPPKTSQDLSRPLK